MVTRLSSATTEAVYSAMQACNKHCVFRCSNAWFSVPAISVRQLVVAPELVRVPRCHPALVGIGRLRGEFLPVVSLQNLLETQTPSELSANDCLMVLDGGCTWSLLISESVALSPLEIIVSQESLVENANNIVIGTAMFRDRIVRALNPNGLLVAAQSALERYWDSSERQFAVSTN
ncbi:MAG: chemotaxis protein CheW [Pirellulaceae bacterium]